MENRKIAIGNTHEIVRSEALGAEAYWLYEITFVDEVTYATVTRHIACDANLYIEDLVRLFRDESFEKNDLAMRLLSAEGQAYAKIGTILSVRQMWIDFFIRPTVPDQEFSRAEHTAEMETSP